ncbi:hypothetical protein V1525DRAFT_421090 [Lipomyces kononenkoae]|uniref:Uncharacterized protein n=1 Tax=Lipomyces kononenkoae TaxID=34357 RepID=A0ACC3SVV2_LIPKO
MTKRNNFGENPGVSGNRMRKGTHSCIACESYRRSKKVRCVFQSEQSKVCVQCSKRGTACVPQGLPPGLQTEYPIRPGTAEDPSSSKAELTLTEALENLRKRVEISLQRVLSTSADQAALPEGQHSASQTGTGAVSSSESVQTDCAPITKLFGSGMIGHLVRPETIAVDLESYSSQEVPNSPLPPRHAQAVHDLYAALPPEPDLKEILHNGNDWWKDWCESFGLVWGDAGDNTIYAFAIQALCSGHPSLLGSLLVCLAFIVDAYEKYIWPVERWILHDDELAGCKYGLQCLMGLVLCYCSALQPRRAWTVYRRANSLLQLNGIHRTHRQSETLDSIFWQLFHADRWSSLMIGLPYSVPDDLCDLYIPTADTIPLVTFHYRHLAVLTGRVIDCLQALHVPAIARIDEQIDAVASHLPSNYLDPAQAYACQTKYARFFRIAHVHQLKAYLHLPLFLQREDQSKREYGWKAYVNSSRTFLEAYIEMYDDNRTRVVTDSTFKLTGFSVFAAAVILFLNLLDCGQNTTVERSPTHWASSHDASLVDRTMAALKACSGGRASSLCRQCHTALEDLESACREVGNGTGRKINLPYFGVVSIGPKLHDHHSTSENVYEDTSIAATREVHGDLSNLSTPLDEIFWDYHGPLMVYDPRQSSPPASGQYHADPDDLSVVDCSNLPVGWPFY